MKMISHAKTSAKCTKNTQTVKILRGALEKSLNLPS